MNICFVGLGYVGLPLALQCARSGASVVVFDFDEPKVDQINCGRSYIKHIADKTIAEHPRAQYCPDGELHGFRVTGVPEDEGRFLQDVYSTEDIGGGPGRFAFDPRAYPTEESPLLCQQNIDRLRTAWHTFWDSSPFKDYYRYIARKYEPGLAKYGYSLKTGLDIDANLAWDGKRIEATIGPLYCSAANAWALIQHRHAL